MKLFCRKCGEQSEGEIKFCRACGAPIKAIVAEGQEGMKNPEALPTVNTEQPAHVEKPSNNDEVRKQIKVATSENKFKFLIIIFSILMVVTALAGGWYYYLYKAKQQPKDVTPNLSQDNQVNQEVGIFEPLNQQSSTNEEVNIDLPNYVFPDEDEEWAKKELVAFGKPVYEKVCAVCHAIDGKGSLPTSPALTDNAIVTGPIEAHLDVVLNGKNNMPAWKGELSAVDIAAVITYVRNALGNAVGDVVQPSAVKLKFSTPPAVKPVVKKSKKKPKPKIVPKPNVVPKPVQKAQPAQKEQPVQKNTQVDTTENAKSKNVFDRLNVKGGKAECSQAQRAMMQCQ